MSKGRCCKVVVQFLKVVAHFFLLSFSGELKKFLSLITLRLVDEKWDNAWIDNAEEMIEKMSISNEKASALQVRQDIT